MCNHVNVSWACGTHMAFYRRCPVWNGPVDQARALTYQGSPSCAYYNPQAPAGEESWSSYCGFGSCQLCEEQRVYREQTREALLEQQRQREREAERRRERRGTRRR